jgi:hypothetical protein
VHSSSSGSSGSLGQPLVVGTVALGLTLIICFPPSGFYLESESASDSEAFSSAMSDFLEQHCSVLCQGLLSYSHHFPMYFFIFSFQLLILRASISTCSIVVWVGDAFSLL